MSREYDLERDMSPERRSQLNAAWQANQRRRDARRKKEKARLRAWEKHQKWMRRRGFIGDWDELGRINRSADLEESPNPLPTPLPPYIKDPQTRIDKWRARLIEKYSALLPENLVYAQVRHEMGVHMQWARDVGATWATIAEHLDISPARARQIHMQFLRIKKHPVGQYAPLEAPRLPGMPMTKSAATYLVGFLETNVKKQS